MDAWTQLASLAHLAELTLDDVIIDLTDGQTPIHSLPSVRVLRLSDISLRGPDSVGSTFCRTFSTMLPNLRELYMPYCRLSITRASIKSHLSLFGNLRKHKL